MTPYNRSQNPLLTLKSKCIIPCFGLFIILLFISCGTDKETLHEEESYKVTELSKDVKDLFVAEGNLNSDTVWIYEQGGPSGTLDEKNLESFPDHDKVAKVYVHQVITYNKELYKKIQLSVTNAEKETDVNTEILHRVITHFKALNKKVIVIGHSYGAFVVTRYLAQKGNTAADKFIIMAGRIDTEKKLYEGLIAKQYFYFPDYKTPTLHPSIQPKTDKERMELFLAGIIGKPRYSQQLNALNLSNMVYVFAKDDDAVGQLTTSEQQFLKSRQVNIITIETGGHSVMFEAPHNQKINKLMIE